MFATETVFGHYPGYVPTPRHKYYLLQIFRDLNLEGKTPQFYVEVNGYVVPIHFSSDITVEKILTVPGFEATLWIYESCECGTPIFRFIPTVDIRKFANVEHGLPYEEVFVSLEVG